MTKTVSFAVGSVEVKLIAEGDRICQSVIGGTPFEPESLEVWGELCAGGGTVLDIGAYSGLYSIAALLMGCRVLAFEPMPFNVGRFKLNAKLNGVVQKVNREAVSDNDGTATIHYNPIPYTSGASLLRKTGTAIAVNCLTIDSLELKSLRAVKIDVERAEPMALRGAQGTLQRLRPSILVEVLGEDEKAAVRAAVPGYEAIRTLDGRNWLMEPR